MRYRELHRWDLDVEEAKKVQVELRRKLILQFPGIDVKTIAGVDLAFKGDKAIAVVVVLSYPDLEFLEYESHIERINYPYIPGLLSFREGPPFLKAWEKVKVEPDIVFFDGQGIAHPRGFGLASHMGMLIEKPSIGVAKSKLFGNYSEPLNEPFAKSPLYSPGGKMIGYVVRTKRNSKPLFVSPGYLMDPENAVHFTLKCVKNYRLPEPTRMAHIFTQRLRKSLII